MIFMVIVYKDEEMKFPNKEVPYRGDVVITSNKSIISERVDFEPEIHIYIQKLMREENKSFNEIVNNIIRKHAEDSICKRVEYIPITIYPTTQVPSDPYPPWTITYDKNTHYYDTKSNRVYFTQSTISNTSSLSKAKTLSDLYAEENNNS